MIFEETRLPGSYLIRLEKRGDDRGFFARAWCRREFEAHGLIAEVAQSNISVSRRRGTLRGLHYQVPPAAETKIVRCTRGTNPLRHLWLRPLLRPPVSTRSAWTRHPPAPEP